MWVVGLEGSVRVVHVHEDVAAGLALGEETVGGVDGIGAGTAAGDDFGRLGLPRRGARKVRRAAPCSVPARRGGRRCPARAGRSRCSPGRRHRPRPRSRRCGARACQRVVHRDEPGAPAAHLEIHQHAERLAGRQCRRSKPVCHSRVVDGNEQSVRAGVERGEAGDLGLGHDLGEEQYARNPGVDHDLRLGQASRNTGRARRLRSDAWPPLPTCGFWRRAGRRGPSRRDRWRDRRCCARAGRGRAPAPASIAPCASPAGR